MNLPVNPPVEPMLARLVEQLPAGWWYEPKWDGFRAVVFRAGSEVLIESRNNRPMARYFPEVVQAVQQALPERCVVDGEIVVPNPEDGKLDFFSLQQRLHPAASRVELLAAQTPATLIVFDLLALGDEDLRLVPFRERRHRLESLVADGAAGVVLTPLTLDIDEANAWFTDFEGAGLDGIVAKHPDSTYQPGKRVMAKLKHDRTADVVVVGYRTHKSSRDAVGSLLLAVYADGAEPVQEWETMFGGLIPIGVAASFPAARRRELFAELAPYVVDLAEHPWAGVAAEATDYPGSRWNPDKDLSFTPLRPELVAEVRFNQLDGGRLRHPAQFLRWRPDRDPLSCRFEQLEATRPRPAKLPIRTARGDLAIWTGRHPPQMSESELLQASFEFSGEIWYWRGPSPFHFVTVPDRQSEEIRDISGFVTYGWGMIPVKVRIGKTEWKTALWPKDGRYIVPLKDVVRKAEKLDLGDMVTIWLEVSRGER